MIEFTVVRVVVLALLSGLLGLLMGAYWGYDVGTQDTERRWSEAANRQADDLARRLDEQIRQNAYARKGSHGPEETRHTH